MANAPNDERGHDSARERDADAVLSEEELKGMDLLGRESVRDGAIPGVSGIGGIPDLPPDAYRRNPPELDNVNNMSGDVSQSGGVAGGTEEGPPSMT